MLIKAEPDQAEDRGVGGSIWLKQTAMRILENLKHIVGQGGTGAPLRQVHKHSLICRAVNQRQAESSPIAR